MMCNGFLVVIGIFASAALIMSFIYYSVVTIGWLIDLKTYTTNESDNTINIKDKLRSIENTLIRLPSISKRELDLIRLNQGDLFQRVNQLEEKLNKRKGK
jgi:hypothetical protein